MAQAFKSQTPAQGHLVWRQLLEKEGKNFKSFRSQPPRRSATVQGFSTPQTPSIVTRTRSLTASDLGLLPPFGLPPSEGGSPSSTFGMGDAVRIAGMRRRPDLNGLHGSVVLCVPDSHGRVCVQLCPHHPRGGPKAKAGESPMEFEVRTKGSQAEAKVVRVLASNLLPYHHHCSVTDASKMGFPGFGVARVGMSKTASGNLIPMARTVPAMEFDAHWERHRGYRRKANGGHYRDDLES